MSASAKLLIAAAVLMLGIAIVLLKVIGGDSATAGGNQQIARPESGGAVEREGDDGPAPSNRGERVADGSNPARPADPRFLEPSRTAAPQLAPSGEDEPIPRDETGLIIPTVTKPEVGQANAKVDPLVRQCLTDHNFKGTGTVLMTFIVARKRERDQTTSVEDSGVEDSGTITDEKLLECLHKTALQMQFPTARTGSAIWGKRKVVIADGHLRESYIVDIGRIR